ncbi:MAG: ATP-binding protein [Syntrophobacteraceae bacterium]
MWLFAKDIIRKIKTGNSDEPNGAQGKEHFERALFDAFPGIIVLVDVQDHTIADLNNSATKVIGAKKSEIVGQSFDNYIHQAPIGCTTADFENPDDGVQSVLITTCGECLPVLRSTAPVTFGGHRYSLEYFVDISAQKRVEEKLAAADSEIEALKEECRVIKDAAKNNIMANIGHELRTPFNAIIGVTEMILDRQFGDLTPLQEEYLGDVAASAHNLLGLINDILDLSRVEGDKLKLEPSLVNLNDLFSRCLVLVKEKAIKHGIKVNTEINQVDETIEADETKLKQILFNLLTGALKFTPDGGEVRLRAEMRQENICISVEDTGLGIKGADLESVLRPFEQSDKPSIHSCQRIQAGLYLTQKLVELHGGRIWVESEGEGKGASFRFLIPRKQNGNDS